jgi:hypothetical protein
LDSRAQRQHFEFEDGLRWLADGRSSYLDGGASGESNMKYLLAFLLTISTAKAVDFSQQDKQSHALLGCASASMFRGFAKDAGSEHENYLGLAGGIGTGVLYELTRHDKDVQEHKQDALASLIGSVVCISVAEGFDLIFGVNSIYIYGPFQ